VRARRLAPLLAGLALAGCGGLRGGLLPGPALEPEPAGQAGWVAWRVEGLRLEAPAAWAASGDARKLTLAADGLRLEAWVVDGRFADGKACLAAAEEALQRGEERLTRVRRHASTLAGRPAVAQEADAGGWHGWAYAACDGAVQYRLFFTGRSPIPAEALEAWREVVRRARLGGAT
jgi:hypothetical protein